MTKEIIYDRLTALRTCMQEKNLDAVWVSGAENHLYASGFYNPDGTLLITMDNAYAFQDFRYIEAVRREIPADLFDVIMPEQPRRVWLPMLLSTGCIQTVGYEDGTLTCRSLAALQNDCPGIRFVAIGDMFQRLRSVKDAYEIDCVEQAQRIAEAAFAQLLPRITYTATEMELAAELEYLMKKNGAQGISFETIAVSGSNSSSPHGVPRNVPLEKGFLTFDFGAVFQGYHSDMTRTVVIGKADAGMRRIYDTVLQAQEAVLAQIGEGQSCFKMDRIARDIIDEAGYAGTFGHGLGHGVGLEIHESPNLNIRSGDAKLRVGEVVTVEPGIYLSGRYGCRIEDMVCIVPGGAHNLTQCPKELIEI
ncbi:MAG: aminopeptidase P family protein [Clostridiales bacterium]|jgi:Xaa-Pro aminopeptidase|nr:aminopeptidase P family protein [Clostridiales bacterium]